MFVINQNNSVGIWHDNLTEEEIGIVEGGVKKRNNYSFI